MISKVKKFIFVASLILFLLLSFVNTVVAEDQFTVYFFYGKTCPHCAKQERFLSQLEQKYNFLEIKKFEVTQNQQNSQLLQKMARRLGVAVRGVPFTVIHEKTVTGYLNDQTTGKEIEEAILHFREVGCPDPVADLLPKDNQEPETQDRCPEKEKPTDGFDIELPFFGTIDTGSVSLPILTILIAAVDGFNPCAMWVLLFLISLLLGMEDKRRMWILGFAFIVASGLVYFLFLSAWLNLFLFLGFIVWVRIIIGIVAISSGVYHLREFWVNKSGACKVVGQEKKKKVFGKLRKITQKKRLAVALIGIILMAFAVNLIELVCSAGLPAVYAELLALTGLSTLQYYSYLLLYILIFMLDDLFVFWLAMRSLHVAGLGNKYSRYSSLIGGVVIFVLGLLLIFKPEWIMFG